MLQENVETYRRIVDAWNREDREAYLAEIGPEFEMHTTGEFIGVESVYRGREGAEKLWSDMKLPFERMWMDLRRIEDLGDSVLFMLLFHGVGRESGAEVEVERAHLTRFDNGRPGLIQNYSSWAEGLEAAGLSA